MTGWADMNFNMAVIESVLCTFIIVIN